jgi:hypothetical protein
MGTLTYTHLTHFNPEDEVACTFEMWQHCPYPHNAKTQEHNQHQQ